MTAATSGLSKRRNARVTTYRLTGSGDLMSRLRDKYLERDTFTSVEVLVGGVVGVLVMCQLQTQQVRWADGLAGYTGQQIDLHNDTAAAVLLLPIGDDVYALCYGMGHHLLDYSSVDAGFGLRYLARVADADNLRSITQHHIDRKALIDRRSIPSGGDIRAFGIGELGTVVSKAIGRHLATDGKKATIRGADGLSIALARDADGLIADLKRIAETLEAPVTHPDLEMLTRLTPIQPRHAMYKQLNACLVAALNGEADTTLLGTGWPWEQADEFSAFDTVRVYAPGLQPIERDWLSIDDLLKIVRVHPTRDPMTILRNTKVMLLDNTDNEISPLIPALKWVACETRIDDTLYFFHDGRWFSVAKDYQEHVRGEAERILASRTNLKLPNWPDGMEEKQYNGKVAKADNRFVLLDRALISTKAHPHGIEHCDLLGPRDEFIHVKRLRASTDASHLFAQAYVATEQLLNDAEGRTKLQEMIASKTKGTRTGPETPKIVVLAVGGRGKLHVDQLFTFSQVTLVRLAQYLETRGIKLQIAALGT